MKISVLPKSLLGKLSVGLIFILCILFIIRRFVFISSSQPIGKTFFDPPIIGILMIGVWIGGLLALLTGIISMKKERSIVVILCIILGLFTFTFGLAEFLIPH